MAKKILILGARQHAKVIVAIIKECYAGMFAIVGFLDDDPALSGTKLLGSPVLGAIKDLEKTIHKYRIAAAAVGISNRYMKVRQEKYLLLTSLGLRVPALIHKKAYVSTFAEVGEGTVINPGVVVNAYAQIGENCVVYSNSTIEHETVLEDNVYIGPGVNFSSHARVGGNTFIGAGAKIIPDITIGKNVIVGAGTVVTRDIPDGVTVVGVPGRVIKRSLQSRI